MRTQGLWPEHASAGCPGSRKGRSCFAVGEGSSTGAAGSVAGLALAGGLVSLLFAGRASSALSTGGWYDPSSESQQVAQRLANDFGDGRSSSMVLFQAPGRTDAASPGVPGRRSARAWPSLGTTRGSTSIVGYAQTGSSMFVSTTGDATWVLVRLNISDDEATPVVDSFRS